MIDLGDISDNMQRHLDEIDGLIPTHIKTKDELNEWEQKNIIDAELWLINKSCKIDEILTIDFIKKLHKKMFSETWRSAGVFRKRNKSIGVNWQVIPIRLQHLIDEITSQMLRQTYPLDELAVRFHHRLAFIHPFANGNGRLARLVTDVFLTAQNQPKFSWGMRNSKDIHLVRTQYLDALKIADGRDYSLLLSFVRS